MVIIAGESSFHWRLHRLNDIWFGAWVFDVVADSSSSCCRRKWYLLLCNM